MIELPKVKSGIQSINPKRLVVYSKPKTGKTTAFSLLDNNLILDLEKGTGWVESMSIEINDLATLRAVGEKIKAEGKPYKFITVDTVTVLEDLIRPLALELYKKTAMGANFKGDNVLTLPQGAGYLYMREAFFQVLDYVDTLAEHVILSGHLKEKAIDDKGQMVMPANIDLTGKIKSLVCSKADAIAYMYRKDNATILSFKSNDEITCGARPEHLRDQEITIVEKLEDGTFVSHWDRIYK
jgi:hypothetical protein